MRLLFFATNITIENICTLTDNVLRRIYATVQLVHIQSVAQFGLNLIGMFLVWHTETIGNLNHTLVDRTCKLSVISKQLRHRHQLFYCHFVAYPAMYQ